MLIRSLQNAIEYSKRLSETQNNGQSIQGVVPDLLIESPHPVFSVSLSPDGSTLAIGRQSGVLDVVSLALKRVVKQFSAVSPNGPESALPIIGSKFGNNNAQLIAASCSGEIFSCNCDKGTKTELTNSAQFPGLMSMDLSPSNLPHLVAGYKDGCIRVFDVNSARKLREISKACASSVQEEGGDDGHSMRVTAVRWIPSGYDNVFVSAGWDSLVKVWDIRLATPLVKQFVGARVCGEGLDVKDRIILAACWSKTDQLQVFDLASSRRLLTATSPFPCDYFYAGRILSTMGNDQQTSEKPTNNTVRMNVKTVVGGCAGVLSVLGIDEEESSTPGESFSVSSLATFQPDLPASGKTVAINCLDAKSLSASSTKNEPVANLAVGLNDGRCYLCKLI